MYWEGVRRYYAPFESEIRAGTADVYRHEMPGDDYAAYLLIYKQTSVSVY